MREGKREGVIGFRCRVCIRVCVCKRASCIYIVRKVRRGGRGYRRESFVMQECAGFGVPLLP